MTKHRHTVFAVFALALWGGIAHAADVRPNIWPFWTGERAADGEIRQWQAVGPLFFHQQGDTDVTYDGMRPLFLEKRDRRATYAEATFLYPLYQQRDDGTTFSWSLLNLINSSRPRPSDAPGTPARAFDVWPFYFSRQTGDAATSYRGFFPVAGTIKRRFGYDRLQWVAFPLTWQSERRGIVTTSTPWPFIKHSAGGGHTGFAVWPLYGHAEKPGEYRRTYALWPLLYRHESKLAEPVHSAKVGFLPFYTRETRAGSRSENFLWPFFGYTRQQTPVRYDENRYLWPLLVQGRGDERYVNRWAPLYTHSIRKGVDKRWFLWPLARREQWTEGGLIHTKRQAFWFVYWSMEQRSVAHPGLAPAEKTHVWPLLSVWDNGAGRKQAQFPSPLEVFFPHNDIVRRLYNPLFALYRYDRRSPEEVGHSLLWNAITWHRSPAVREFHLGPLFSTRHTAETERLALGSGLIGLQRPAGQRVWRLFLFDFSRQKDHVGPRTAP
jgi:hypothetical protein